MGKFHQILMELSARDMPIFSFRDDNLSKCQGILPNLVYALILRRKKIKEIWFGIANGQISSILTDLYDRNTMMVGYYRFTFLFHFIFFFILSMCKVRQGALFRL